MAYKEKETKKWTAQWFETNARGEKKKRRKRGFETKREALELFFASTNYLKMQRHFPKVAAGNSSKLHKLPGAC